MNERFDDMIRRRLEGHESTVPDGLFDAINNRPEVQDAFFDDAIRSKLTNTETPIPAGTFDAINAAVGLAHLGFDSTVRDRMEQHASAVPSDMWQRIMAEKERRRRPIAWWWMAATVLLLVGAGTTFLLKQKETSPSSIAVATNKVTSQPGSQSVEKQLEETPVNKDAIATNPAEQNALTATPNQISSSQITQKTSDQNGLEPINSPLQISEPSVANKTLFWKRTQQKTTTRTKKNDSELTNALQAGSAVQPDDESNLVTVQLSILELLRNTARLSPGHLLKAKPHAPVIPCPTNADDKRNDWYVDVYSSAYLLQKNIQDKGINKNVKAGFDTTLHQQVSFNAGINLVKNIGENFLLKTGVQYNRINESFRLTQINERRLVTTISVRTVIIAPGDTVHIRDTSTVEQIGTVQRRNQNHYTQWDVPLIIGYEFGGENLRLNANAGIITNIRSSYSGQMIADSTQQIIDVNNYKGTSVYKKSVGFSLYAGVSILKPLSEKVSLLIEPHARVNLNNTTNSQAWFNQKNSTWGVSLGLRYKFGGSRQRIY